MGQSNTFATTNPGSAVGNTEELTRGAHRISPGDTPFYSNTTKVKAKSVMPEWVLDDRNEVVDTPIAEGADAVAFEDQFDNQAKVFNYIQTLEENPKVTDDQDLVDNVSGVNFAGAVVEALKRLNLKTEKALLSKNARGVSGAVRTAAGLGEQIGGASGVFPAEYQTPSAQVVTGTAPTEVNVDTVLRSMSDESGVQGNYRCYAGSAWISAFAGNTMRLTSSNDNRTSVNISGEKGVIKNKIRVYEGQHGDLELFNLNSKTLFDTSLKSMAYFINPDQVSIKELGGLINKELPDLGGGRRSTIRRKFALCVKQPKAHAFWNSIA